MAEQTYTSEVIIAGGGLAGIVTAYELLDQGKRVLLFDKDTPEKFGGLAKDSFGGIHMIGTPYQKRNGTPDNPDLAYRDWLSYAEFTEEDELPRAWARFYCENSLEYIFHFLDSKGVKFLPIVNWPERGYDAPGNSVPRWHITWGIGQEIIRRLLEALEKHPRRNQLEIKFNHEVSDIVITNGVVTGITGKSMTENAPYTATGEHVVIATGGMCGGDLSKVRQHWPADLGPTPEKILNGAHPYGDGLLQDRVQDMGGRITHLDKQWHYAAGVHHPVQDKPGSGLSLVPPRSALWVNAHGQRIRNPHPIVPYTDTRHMVASICQQPGQYSWQVMNQKIALKELAVSGCSYMTAFVEKSKPMLLKHLLFGNHDLVNNLLRDCPDDIVTATTLEELVDKMNERNLYGHQTDLATLKDEIQAYDNEIARGPKYFNDEQLRRIQAFRGYRGDKVRMCKFQPILDPKAQPLIAIREFILARKSLGGIQTDLSSQALKEDGTPFPGLYAVGEAAGFGGGGIHGKRSLEGTFLGSCVLTGRIAAQSIAKG